MKRTANRRTPLPGWDDEEAVDEKKSVDVRDEAEQVYPEIEIQVEPAESKQVKPTESKQVKPAESKQAEPSK